jgi:hypothetical protein
MQCIIPNLKVTSVGDLRHICINNVKVLIASQIGILTCYKKIQWFYDEKTLFMM